VDRHQAELDAAARVTEPHQKNSLSHFGEMLSPQLKKHPEMTRTVAAASSAGLHRDTFPSHRSGSASVCIVIIA
jgi:hypothetical protein